MTETLVTREEPPPDCAHTEWTFGCPRCFFEMEGLAKSTITTDRTASQIEGAVLMAWHVMFVMIDMEAQLAPITRGLDLRKRELGLDIIANLRQVQVYLTKLVADERKLMAALTVAATVAKEMEAKARADKEAPTAAPSSIVLTD